ncbi:hypothetical protein JF544_05255 [Halobacillus kuroshimensis]|uniref:Uncharacterized protein n=1 Tax=Halobacillus kuroshimensis TaxID=302481 RepID=A0ABS3DTK0_9BACI|nr:hypothetical protein [Halobacillus kuroshimensis]MBN8234644.1 hypothetical protein [Halobacillus kuroshimensis]
MTKPIVVTPEEFERQLFQLQEKFSLLERRMSLKADEIVFSMTVAHRKEVDELKEEVLNLQGELRHMKKEKRQAYMGRIAQQAKKRSVG